MARWMFLTALVTVLPVLSLARAETSVLAPAVRPMKPTVVSSDLAILGGDRKLSPVDPVGPNGVTATYSVAVKNLGAATITQVGVACRLGTIEFANAASNVTLAQNQQAVVVLTTTAPWSSVPTGTQSIQCAAAITAPAATKDTNTANNAWSGSVMARPLPDLKVTAASLRDCHTGGAATIGDTVCIGLEYANAGGPIYQNAFVECSVTRISPAATWKLPLVNLGALAANTSGKATPIFADGNVTGQYRTTCTADPSKALSESNESNNALVVSSSIVVPEYDVAVVSTVNGSGTCSVTSGQYQFATPYTVTVRNDGTKEITGVSVACKFPNRAVGEGTAASTTSLAPKATTAIPVCFAPPSRPSEQLYCKATITGPTEVTDQRPGNDYWFGATATAK